MSVPVSVDAEPGELTRTDRGARSSDSPPLGQYRGPLRVVLYVGLIALGYRAAFELRFDFNTPANDAALFWVTLPVLLTLRIVAYSRFGIFRSYWHHFGLRDLSNLARAVTISSGAFIVVLMLMQVEIPRSIYLLDWAGAILLAGSLPFATRSLREASHADTQATGRRTLVIGAGEKAERLLREVHRGLHVSIRVVGLVDDRQANQGRWLHGLPVIGTTKDLPSLIDRFGIEFIVIALDTDKGENMQRVVERCVATRVAFKTLPSLEDLLEGVARVDQLRDVRIEDLLGRPAVRLDLTLVEAGVRDRVVLITGGAGSIGSELARQAARFRPARLVLLDQAESELYFVNVELTTAHPDLDVQVVICDVADEMHVSQVFDHFRPHWVLHAAAYKHVPLLEVNVIEAVRNNVVGTLVVAEAAVRSRVEQVLLISTDKAINPSSVMGATKRIAERIIFGLPSLQHARTIFRAVRFGNVLASNGSVVPLFERQLAAGGPITVTHPEVERYFMTIPEAAQLVLQASSLPETAGRIVMLDMGEPVRILELAERLIRLSGLEPHRDVRIVFTGLRPGEKLQEDLISALEDTIPTAVEKIRVVEISDHASSGVEKDLGRLLGLLDEGDPAAVVAQLAELVPECVPPLQLRRGQGVSTNEAHEVASLQVATDLEGHSAPEIEIRAYGSDEHPGVAAGKRAALRRRKSPEVLMGAVRAAYVREEKKAEALEEDGA